MKSVHHTCQYHFCLMEMTLKYPSIHYLPPLILTAGCIVGLDPSLRLKCEYLKIFIHSTSGLVQTSGRHSIGRSPVLEAAEPVFVHSKSKSDNLCCRQKNVRMFINAVVQLGMSHKKWLFSPQCNLFTLPWGRGSNTNYFALWETLFCPRQRMHFSE